LKAIENIEMKPIERLRKALEISAEFSSAVKPPFIFKSL